MERKEAGNRRFGALSYETNGQSRGKKSGEEEDEQKTAKVGREERGEVKEGGRLGGSQANYPSRRARTGCRGSASSGADRRCGALAFGRRSASSISCQP